MKLRYFDRNYKEKGICNKETGEKGEHSERCKEEIVMRWDGMGWDGMEWDGRDERGNNTRNGNKLRIRFHIRIGIHFGMDI